MGLLIKYAVSSYVLFTKPDSDAGFVRIDEPPYTIGKLVKIKDDQDAIDFKAKQLQYYIGQVPGYKIFFVHAGFFKPPSELVPDDIVKQNIDGMCRWYLETRMPYNKSLQKTFKIQP